MTADISDIGDLTADEWRGITQLEGALFQCEPLAKRGNLGEKVAEHLVNLGWAIKGPTSTAYQARDMPIGYKLSDVGWALRARGRYARRAR